MPSQPAAAAAMDVSSSSQPAAARKGIKRERVGQGADDQSEDEEDQDEDQPAAKEAKKE